MNLPYSWLQELVPELPDVQALSDLLPSLGLGVERVYELPAPPPGVVAALVETLEPIAGSDHLTLCTVDDGAGLRMVVCGAPNVKEGMLTAYARPGVYLPGVDLTVETRDILGVSSEGMLCSPRELGLYDYGGGLSAFGDDVTPGQALADLWRAETVLELELTPNRADAFSLLGIARDVAAKLGVPYKHPAADAALADPTIDDGLTVQIEDREACPRFTLRRIDGVTVKPSPIWLQRRLATLGLRPRNGIVDVTNYVTFELGQPSHAYDRDALTDGTIVVRRARAGETLTTLNEDRLTFTEDDLLITMPDGEGGTRPIGVAGVIGGLADSVREGTTSVALEAAHFDPVTVRKTARRHGLSTDAHYRFERGVDPNLSPLASARAAQLIAEVAGGRVHPGITEVGGDAPLEEVAFRPSRVAFLMALDIPTELQRRFLETLGCRVEVRGEDDWRVTVPSWRFDLAIEEDLIEEVSRLYGYDHIGETVPVMSFVPDGSDATYHRLKLLLAGFGFQEALGYAFTGEAELKRAGAPRPEVELLNPQGLERSVLRTALYPGLVQAAMHNRSQSALALFEIGRVFAGGERERLALLVCGPWQQGLWQADQESDFYLFKGLLEKLAASLGATLTLEPQAYPHLHPGVSASVVWAGERVGSLGRLHPEVAERYELPDVYVAELELPLAGAEVAFKDYLRQPHAERDVAVIVPQEVSYAQLERRVRETAGERLERLWPFDVYEGPPIPEGHKSLALRLWFRHPGRALQDREVDGFMANVITSLKSEGYAVRDR